MNALAKFKDDLGKREAQIAAVLGKEETFQGFLAAAAALVGTHPEWLDTGKYHNGSLLQSCMYAAQSKLSMDPNLGHVYFVPRWNKKTRLKHICFQVGYKGLMELAFRSGHFLAFNAELVYEGDKFDYGLGTQSFLNHKPTFKGGNLTHAWARAVPVSMTAESPFIVIDAEEVKKARSLSESGASDFSPWNKFYSAMVRKTAVRRLAPFLHLATDMQRVIGIEDRVNVEFLKDARPTDARQNLLALARERNPVDGGSTDAPGEPPPPGDANPGGDGGNDTPAVAPPGEDLFINDANIPPL